MAHLRSIPQLKKYIESLGGTLEVCRINGTRLCADAPRDKIWSASGTHSLVADTAPGPHEWLLDTIEDIRERAAHGLEDCPDGKECEVCYPEEEESV